MSTQRTVARNIIWNWAGTVINMAAGFAVTPYMVHGLGHTLYGLWILIASLTNYFGFLDLGIRGAVGRNIAFLRAKHDTDGVNAVLSTALVLLSIAAMLALSASMVLLLVFAHF